MKRISHYLLTHHPLAWNLRLHWVLPGLLLLNGLFYLAGLLEPASLKRLSYAQAHMQPEATSVAVLVGILAIIFWLVYYLRNNAFKNLYPLRRGQLFLEFLSILSIVGLASLLPFSYQQGRYDRWQAVTADIDVVRESNIAALAAHFLPFEAEDFDRRFSCDSMRAREAADSAWMATHPGSDGAYDRPGYYDGRNGTYLDSALDRSYLHYCQEPPLIIRDYSRYNSGGPQPTVRTAGAFSRDEVNAVATRYMRGGRQDSVRAVIEDFLRLAVRYGGSHRMSVEGRVREIFATPEHTVQTYLGTSPHNDAFIEYVDERVTDAHNTTLEFRRGIWDSEMVLFMLHWMLSAALVVYSFRMTARRPWAIAFVGMGVWLVLFAVLSAFMRHDNMVGAVFLLLVPVLAGYAIANIVRGRNKLFSAVAGLWALWVLPVYIPCFAAWLKDFYRGPEYYGNYQTADGQYFSTGDAVWLWLDCYEETIAWINVAAVLVLVAVVIIPLLRRWQSNPEE